MDTSDLDMVLGGDLIEFRLVFWLGEINKLDVYGSSESGSHVRWASSDVTEMFGVGELGFGLDLVGGISESGENLEDVAILLHGNDSEMVFLIDPDEESLGIVVENTTSLWPLSLKTGGF